jgi:hypothetical protein
MMKPSLGPEVEAAAGAQHLGHAAIGRRRLPDLRSAIARVEGEDVARLVGEVEAAVGGDRPANRGCRELDMPRLAAGVPGDGVHDGVVAREVDRVADDRDVVRDAAPSLELPVEDGLALRALDPIPSRLASPRNPAQSPLAMGSGSR